MSRYLFVVPPLVGHVNPLVGVAAELAARGHPVAWAGVPELVRRLAGPDARVFPSPASWAEADRPVRPADIRGPEALRFLWERFLVPLADAMADGVREAVLAFRPDVVVADQQAPAGALVAERLGVPWATSATTPAEFTDALAGMPKAAAWIDGLLRELRSRIGDPEGAADPRFSPRLVLAFTVQELAGPPARGGDAIRWVGPSLGARPPLADFPWEWLDAGRATVLVTLGTANTGAGGRFLTACAEALRARADRLQAVVVDPEGALRGRPGTAGACGSSPEAAGARGVRPDGDLLALPAVPQLALLEHVDAVVCHAGHNTVVEALGHGVPLVVAPIRDDQPVVAAQVCAAGAGVRVRFGRATAARIGSAVDAVLYDPGHRAAARAVGTALHAAGGAAAAADHLERMPEKPRTPDKHRTPEAPERREHREPPENGEHRADRENREPPENGEHREDRENREPPENGEHREDRENREDPKGREAG
ncbi:glycosyl transferase [Streptomyces spongiicola]|uniref:Glycosyl transferase n=1 Tax=Streptomyces spongiicola TaxID=1690221 RepID=A0A388T0S0_9ACTN|nr:glycosyltransferase [Streptomyces spongiicola]GBQ02507.1 glycosyl transferase [Streptomyces spongiicola]